LEGLPLCLRGLSAKQNRRDNNVQPKSKTPGQAQQEKSKFYEEAFQAILQFKQSIGILQVSGVERSKSYQGQLSGTRRQIDATIHLHDGQRILVECKQRRNPSSKLHIEYVEAFDAKCRLDIGQDVAVLS
jgi:hypothetical protein